MTTTLFISILLMIIVITGGQDLPAILNPSSDVTSDDIQYYLYTREINGTELTENTGSCQIFNSSKETVILIHGWRDSHLNDSVQLVKDAYLKSRDVNIIAMDWNSISRRDYLTSQSSVPAVGQLLGQFIIYFRDNCSLQMENFGLVGHSLGAHVAGVAGWTLGGSIDRIIGLDPAGPLYTLTEDKDKLSEGDAQFVQIIHTDAGGLGTSEGNADADYWPNGGGIQPGCLLSFRLRCSHDRSFEYYVESLLTGRFRSVECSDSVSYGLGLCNNNREAYMGQDASDRSTGNFYLSTNAQPPYAQG